MHPADPDVFPRVSAAFPGPRDTPVIESDRPDGAALLDRLKAALTHYVVMASDEAADSVVLWIAATHAQPAWEHATRLGITGPMKRCGKSRLLEIVKATVHKPLPAVHASTAALFRSIGSEDPPTILFDEVDAIFGSKKAAEANEDLRALINAGHSRGWPVVRCTGPNQQVTAFTSFAMVALSGIGDLPDTITDRAVNIRMRRRAPGEPVKPFRTKRDTPALFALREQLNTWLHDHLDELETAEPDMPVEDRAADTWESLVAVADLAGGTWPERARLAAKILTEQAADNDTDMSLTTRLLADLRSIFGTAPSLYTSTILERLHAINDAPWAERQLSANDLAKTLKTFNVKPREVRENGGRNLKGYKAADLHDPWSRYLPRAPVALVAAPDATPRQAATA